MHCSALDSKQVPFEALFRDPTTSSSAHEAAPIRHEALSLIHTLTSVGNCLGGSLALVQPGGASCVFQRPGNLPTPGRASRVPQVLLYGYCQQQIWPRLCLALFFAVRAYGRARLLAGFRANSSSQIYAARFKRCKAFFAI